MAQNESGWHPDPSGRHQYRWWDGEGATWTDQVADNDVVTTDPLAAAAATETTTAPEPEPTIAAPTPEPQPTPQPVAAAQAAPQPMASQPVASQPTVAAPTGGSAPSGSSDAKSKLPLLIGGGVGVLVLGAIAFFVLGGDSGGDDGTGAFSGTIEGDDGVFVRQISVEPGDAIGVEFKPASDADDLDGVIVLSAADDDSDAAIIEFEEDELELEDSADQHDALKDTVRDNTNVRVDGDVFAFRDDTGPGDDEGFGLTFPVAGTFNVSVMGFEDTEGDFTLTIAKQATTEDVGDKPSADDIDDLTSGEHEDFLADFTDDPLLFSDLAGGGGSGNAVLDLLTDELVATAGLDQPDAACVSGVILDEIGVDGLAQLGLAAGAGGDIENLDDDAQADLFDLIFTAFDDCGIDPTAVN